MMIQECIKHPVLGFLVWLQGCSAEEFNGLRDELQQEAVRLSTAGGFMWYAAKLSNQKVTFKVPEKEAFGFGHIEPAQLLIRWISE